MLLRKHSDVQEVGRRTRVCKLAHKYKFCETLRAGPTTPCASFLTSYNKVEENCP